MRRCLFLLLVIPAVPLRAAVPTLEQVLAEARERNPEILAAGGAAAAAAARVSPAGTWPPPLLTYSREKVPGAAGVMIHAKAEQDVPFPGKLSSEAGMARHAALLEDDRFKAKVLEVAARTRNAYYALFRSDALIDRLADGVQSMSASLRSAEARVAGGSAPADEALSMKAELGRMENMLGEERQARVIAAVELNVLLDRPVDSPWGPVAAPAVRTPKEGLPALLRLAEAQSPMFQASIHEKSHAAAMLGRARREALPDFALMYDRQAAGGMTGYEAGLGVRLPLWWSRPAGGLREARAHVEETDASAEVMRNEVRRMTAVEYAEVQTRVRNVRRYESDILPAARGAFRLSRRRYESGRGDFTRMMDAWRAWLSAERDYAGELYHASEHWGMLESAVGAPLEENHE